MLTLLLGGRNRQTKSTSLDFLFQRDLYYCYNIIISDCTSCALQLLFLFSAAKLRCKCLESMYKIHYWHCILLGHSGKVIHVKIQGSVALFTTPAAYRKTNIVQGSSDVASGCSSFKIKKTWGKHERCTVNVISNSFMFFVLQQAVRTLTLLCARVSWNVMCVIQQDCVATSQVACTWVLFVSVILIIIVYLLC